MCCCLSILVMTTIKPHLCYAPGRFVRFRTMLTLLQSMMLIVHAVLTLSNQDAGVCDRNRFDALLVGAEALELGIAMSQLAQSAHLLSLLRDPFRPLRHVRKLSLVIFISTCVEPLSVLVLLTHHSASGQRSSNPQCWGVRMVALVSGWRSVLASCDLAMVGCAVLVSSILLVRLRSGLVISRASRSRASQQEPSKVACRTE